MAELHDLLVIEEQRIGMASTSEIISSSNVVSSVFSAIQQPSRADFQQETRADRPRFKGKFRKNKIFCKICGKAGHSAAECFHRLNINYQKPRIEFKDGQQGPINSRATAYLTVNPYFTQGSAYNNPQYIPHMSNYYSHPSEYSVPQSFHQPVPVIYGSLIRGPVTMSPPTSTIFHCMLPTLVLQG